MMPQLAAGFASAKSSMEAAGGVMNDSVLKSARELDQAADQLDRSWANLMVNLRAKTLPVALDVTNALNDMWDAMSGREKSPAEAAARTQQDFIRQIKTLQEFISASQTDGTDPRFLTEYLERIEALKAKLDSLRQASAQAERDFRSQAGTLGPTIDRGPDLVDTANLKTKTEKTEREKQIEKIMRALQLLKPEATAVYEQLERIGDAKFAEGVFSELIKTGGPLPEAPANIRAMADEVQNMATLFGISTFEADGLVKKLHELDEVRQRQAVANQLKADQKITPEEITMKWAQTVADMEALATVVDDTFGALFNGLEQGFNTVFQNLLTEGQTFASAMQNPVPFDGQRAARRAGEAGGPRCVQGHSRILHGQQISIPNLAPAGRPRPELRQPRGPYSRLLVPLPATARELRHAASTPTAGRRSGPRANQPRGRSHPLRATPSTSTPTTRTPSWPISSHPVGSCAARKTPWQSWGPTSVQQCEVPHAADEPGAAAPPELRLPGTSQRRPGDIHGAPALVQDAAFPMSNALVPGRNGTVWRCPAGGPSNFPTDGTSVVLELDAGSNIHPAGVGRAGLPLRGLESQHRAALVQGRPLRCGRDRVDAGGREHHPGTDGPGTTPDRGIVIGSPPAARFWRFKFTFAASSTTGFSISGLFLQTAITDLGFLYSGADETRIIPRTVVEAYNRSPTITRTGGSSAAGPCATKTTTRRCEPRSTPCSRSKRVRSRSSS
jgi:hypothetical protein